MSRGIRSWWRKAARNFASTNRNQLWIAARAAVAMAGWFIKNCSMSDLASFRRQPGMTGISGMLGNRFIADETGLKGSTTLS